MTLFYGRLKRIYFVGIGGVGMCGIAEVLLDHGFEIHGSDIKESDNTRRLQSLGAIIHIGHKRLNVQGADVVVVSTDIKSGNVEVLEALEHGIPVIPRAEMLAELMKLKHGIAVAGSHGKTTTTSMVASILQHAGLDPTVVIGGKVNHMSSNAKAGKGNFLVAEADESDGSFLLLSPSLAVVTNIDPEHLDYWRGGIDEIKSAFMKFLNRLPFYGLGVVCLDSEHVRAIVPYIKRRICTYALHHPADFRASAIKQEGLYTTFNVHKHGELLGNIKLRAVGAHNVANALAATAIGDELKIPFAEIKVALEHFSGVQRRFTLVGEANGVTVIDDYGHHPTEIKAVLQGAKDAFPKRRINVVFQPHRYTRLFHLINDFATSFDNADNVIVTDIYAANETPIEGMTGSRLCQEIRKVGHKHVFDIGDVEQACKKAAHDAKPGDIVITLGAGHITSYAPKIVQWLSHQTGET